MKKYAGYFGIGILSMLIGIVLAVQISTTAGSDQGGLVPLAKLKGYEQALKDVRAEKEAALEELGALEKRLKEIEETKAMDDESLNNLVINVEKYKMASGSSDVAGPGVFIVIKDPPAMDDHLGAGESSIAYNPDLLLSVVNKLKEAGAEAISINEQRIVNTTEISLAGNNIVINGKDTAPPYAIKAIGNPETLQSAITIRGGIVEEMKNIHGLVVNVKQEEYLQIARYSANPKFVYAKPIEEEKNE